MKRILKLILIAVLAFSSLKAQARILDEKEIKTDVARQAVSIYRNFTDAELSVKVVTLPFKDIDVPDGKVSFTVSSNTKRFVARDLLKVCVYVNNRYVRTFNAPVVIKAWESVLVAACDINREKQITPDVVTVKKIEVSDTLGYHLKPESLNKEVMAKKFFREGEVIDKRFVKLKPEVLRNSNVTVMFQKENLTVSVEATALSDGSVGDSICLVNKKYNRVYTGKVIGESKVLVGI